MVIIPRIYIGILIKLLYKSDNSFILYCRTKILMSFIIENTILLSDGEWGVKDKSAGDKCTSWLPMG